MKRTKMITKLLKLYRSFPEGASDYHKVDFLLRKAERLGMLPPAKGAKMTVRDNEDGTFFIPFWKWDEEDE